MRALTVCQPYASAIISGSKDCENRTWNMRWHRGPLLIHASKSRSWLGEDERKDKSIIFGAILGVVEVVDCLQLADYLHKYGNDVWGCFGPWCIRMERKRAFITPIPWKGERGLFYVPDDIVRSQMELVA